jgi:hypothetical protein
MPRAEALHLAPWDFAGLMVTYWCNARCAFCYVYSAPDRGGDMSVASAVELWRGLDRLAAAHGKTMRVHLAGGEPFGDWPLLLAIVRAARDAALTRLEKIETNAFWATDDDLTRARLEQLDAMGMEKLLISADVYHQEFVPLERVQRCVVQGRKVLGPGRVRVRWWDFLQDPVDLRRRDPVAKRRAYAAALERHKDRLTGRAAERLADFFPRFPAEHFRGDQCVNEVLHSRHVHVDPYGNVFPGVCSGIILGSAAARPIDQLWRDLAANWRAHAVVSAVVAGGSYELMQRVRPLGYAPLAAGYANKCHLCTHVRQFLVERGLWTDTVGPRECYGNAADAAETALRAYRPLPLAAQPPR